MQRHRRRQRHRRADPAIGGATLHPAVVDMGGRGAAVGAQGGKEGVEAEVGRVSVIGNPVRYPLPEHVEGGRPSLEEKEKRCFDKLSTNGGKVILRSGKSDRRSEEHTSELQSLMRISYAVFCLKKKKTRTSQEQKYK